MRLTFDGTEVPAYIEISKTDLLEIVESTFGFVFDFKSEVSCITLEVIPYYFPKPKSLEEAMCELCLRGKVKRNTYLVEIKND